MEQPPESGKDEESQPSPTRPPSPKRGAIPAPRAEIEKATPYVIDTGSPDEDQPSSPAKPPP